MEQNLSIVKAPVTIGQPHKGADLSPDLLLSQTTLVSDIMGLGWKVKNITNASFQMVENDPPTDEGVHYPRSVGAANFAIHNAVYNEVMQDRFVLTLGGDHSIAAGSVSAILRARPDTVVVWVDAHADLNTPLSSPSGNIHGMPVSFLLGIINGGDRHDVPGWEWINPLPKLNKNNLTYVGLRDLDPEEKNYIRNLGIHSYSMYDIDKESIGEIMAKAIHSVDPFGTKPIHLSFDIDAIDPLYASATGTPVLGGLTFREAAFICETLAETRRLCSMDLTEINTKLAKTEEDAKNTLDVGKRLIKCALGETLVWGSRMHNKIWKL